MSSARDGTNNPPATVEDANDQGGAVRLPLKVRGERLFGDP
ncbi:hypothetical protein [Micromonospora sp. NPDC048839]